MREHNNGVSHHKKGKKPSGKEEGGFMVGVLGWLGGLGWPPVAIRKLTPLPALQAAWEVTLLLLPSNSSHPAQTVNSLLRMRRF